MSIVVVDASVWCDALLPGSRRDVARTALNEYSTIAAPEHLRLEIIQVLRRHSRRDLGKAQAAAVIDVIREMPLEVVPTVEILPRIWELRDSLTAYDAAYLAAAEQLGASLLTRDKGLLARSGDSCCEILTTPE